MIAVVRRVIQVAFVAALAVPAFALTYIVPSDAEMIQRSDAIVVATVEGTTVERSLKSGIVTRYTLRIEEVLKGDLAPSQLLVLTELGGQLGDMFDIVPGRPEYVAGERYLVFTESGAEGEPITFGFALGQFRLQKRDGVGLAVRGEIHGFDQNLEPFVDRGRDLARFEQFIRDTVAGRAASSDYFVVMEALREGPIESNAGFAASSYVSNASNFRWPNPAYDFILSKDQPGADEAAALATAIAEWNFTGTDIALGDAGRNDSKGCSLCSSSVDGDNVVEFNVPSLEGGAAGIARVAASGTHSFAGETFANIIEGDVQVRASIDACVVAAVVTHEIGHTLGFRHSNEGKPGYTCGVTAECTADAIMNFQVGCSDGPLQAYDQTAAETVYGDGPVCNPPTITTHPQNKSISVGATTSLTVVPGGSGPFTFQWFFGNSGDTSNPVNGANTATINITPTSPGVGSYWVRVGHSCDAVTVNSNAATVTATCTNPAITGQPQSPPPITGGQSTTLQVTATGSNLTFQWYRGTTGDRSNPVGTNSNRLTVSPLETTSYWVEVSGACGDPVGSGTVTVTVIPCAAITVDAPVATPQVGVGKFTLSVSATSTASPLTYGWFRGGTPGFGGSPAGTGQSISVTVTQTTNYWARIQNSCGRVEYSTLITVAPCALPSITTQPQDQTVNSGANANLSIAFTNGDSVKWYRGTLGDKTNQVGTTANISVGPLTATTKFWAEVTKNNCGAVSSREVTVTVIPLSELVQLLNGRFFVQVNYKNQFDNNKTGKLLGRSLFSTALSETAVFTFGDQNVVELLVRVSDARPFDDNIHIFLGGLSDVEFSVVVTDSLTGIIHEYKKPANQLVGVIDRTTFPASNALAPPIALKIEPAAEVSTIRLLNNRFEVRMRYRNQFTNPPGEGYMNARSIASSSTTETAVFFFDENVGSAEWMVRFSDARPFANRIDLFHGGLSDVEFTIEVLDTKTGQRKEYHKGPFSLLGQVDRNTYLP